MNTDKLKQLARDLRKTPPHSPRDTLGGFVIAARMLDKARADLLGINGEYSFYGTLGNILRSAGGCQ
jgi:hypothetical protein